jgi:curli biogenesis system outer membrane secretion channel CsgG
MSVKAALGAVAAAGIVLLATGSSELKAAPKSKRPTIAVMDFDYGTINSRWWGNYDIGKGMADQVMNALVDTNEFRVIERKKIDTVLAEQDFSHSDRAAPSEAKRIKIGKLLGVQFIVTGSITKFSTEQNKKGVNIRGIGVSAGKAKTEVFLTARVIDVNEGTILIGAKGEGTSGKGGGFGFSKGSLGIDMDNPEFRDSAIGEAQQKACDELVAQIVARKENLEEE